jgi:hypothetical protein
MNLAADQSPQSRQNLRRRAWMSTQPCVPSARAPSASAAIATASLGNPSSSNPGAFVASKRRSSSTAPLCTSASNDVVAFLRLEALSDRSSSLLMIPTVYVHSQRHCAAMNIRPGPHLPNYERRQHSLLCNPAQCTRAVPSTLHERRRSAHPGKVRGRDSGRVKATTKH